jgi:hypothetical protein
VLPERLTPVGILEFCDGLRLIALERQAEAAGRFERLLERLMGTRYYPTLRGEMRKIYIAGVHFARAVFATYANDGSRALESANALDALDIKFYAMIASQIRFLYHMNRGDFRTARHHRQQVDIHAAHVGSAWQVEMWEAAALIPIHTWLLDVDGMSIVADRLEAQSKDVPSLRKYAQLARWAQGLVLTDQTRQANAMATLTIMEEEPRSYIGWAAHLGFTAMGSRALGDHEAARRMCDLVDAHVTDADREYVGLFLVAEIERAWCDAMEGRRDAAIEQLDALIERHKQGDNPLVPGLLHEARAHIAYAAGRESEYAESAAEVERRLRPLGTPALIAKCERLAALRSRGRSAGRRENAEVTGSTCSPATTAIKSGWTTGSSSCAARRTRRARRCIAGAAGASRSSRARRRARSARRRPRRWWPRCARTSKSTPRSRPRTSRRPARRSWSSWPRSTAARARRTCSSPTLRPAR